MLNLGARGLPSLWDGRALTDRCFGLLQEYGQHLYAGTRFFQKRSGRPRAAEAFGHVIGPRLLERDFSFICEINSVNNPPRRLFLNR